MPRGPRCPARRPAGRRSVGAGSPRALLFTIAALIASIATCAPDRRFHATAEKGNFVKVPLHAVPQAGHGRITARPASPRPLGPRPAWHRISPPRTGCFWTHAGRPTPHRPSIPHASSSAPQQVDSGVSALKPFDNPSQLQGVGHCRMFGYGLPRTSTFYELGE
jgi:hypothetical protein